MDFTKEKVFSLEKKISPIFDASLVSHYSYHPSLLKPLLDNPEILINRDACPLNLTVARNDVTKVKPLESKVKNVLKRLRVGIGNTVVDSRVAKKEKNYPLIEKVPIAKTEVNNVCAKNPTLPNKNLDKIPVNTGSKPLTVSGIKNEPVRKNLLDLKVRNVIKRLRVGIIKDLNDKDPVDLTSIKNELNDSRNEIISSDVLDVSNIKIEFEEDSRLDLEIIKQESLTEHTSQVSGAAEVNTGKNNCSLINVGECDLNMKSIVGLNNVEEKSVDRNNMEKNLSGNDMEKNVLNIASVEKQFPQKVLRKVNLVTSLQKRSSLDISSLVRETHLLSDTFDESVNTSKHNLVVNPEITSSGEHLSVSDALLVENKSTKVNLLKFNNNVNESIGSGKTEKEVAEKPCLKKKNLDASISMQELVNNGISVVNPVKNELKEDSLLNLNVIKSKSKKKLRNDVKIHQKKHHKKKMTDKNREGKKLFSQDIIFVKECHDKGSSDFNAVCDKMVENNFSDLIGEKNEQEVKNLLIMKIVRKKGSKTGKLEVQMIEKKSVKSNVDGLVKNLSIENKCLGKEVDDNLEKDLHENNLSDNKKGKKNESFRPLADSATNKTGNALMNANYNTSERFTKNSMLPLLVNFCENSINAEKVTNESGEFIPTDILQTEILQSFICVLCKNDQVIPLSRDCSDKSDLFVCKTCENLLDKSEIEMKLENIKNSTKCNVLNVTCFKCNLSFSSEKEIELHNLTHKNDDNSLPFDMGKNIRPQFCRLCHTGKNISTNQMCVHLRKRRHKCEYCFKLFLSKSDLRKHINIHTREVTYDCKLCERSFSCQSNLRKHMETHDDKRERLYKCKYCEKSFYKPDHLKVHVNVHTSEKLYECPYCEKTFTRKYCLQLHINIHTLEKVYECTICGRTCMDKSTLRKHMALHSDESPYKCEHCDRAFKQKTQLDAHTNSHTLSKLYFCDYCNKSFINKTNLRKHIELHMGNKEGYLCLFCNKMYSSKGNLCIHINRHTNLKSYDCTYCSRSFKDPSSLKKHVNIHTKENKFHCADCGKVFIRKTHLKNHINSHMGIKPHKCDSCGKSFAQRSYLKVHIENTHIGLKRFHCLKCDKQFKTKINLDVHMNTHTHEKLFRCFYCSKVCTQKANLQTHIMKYHADEIVDDLKL